MSTTGSPPGATLRAVIYAPRRLDELSTARVIEHIADVVHKQQKGGHALGTLTPDAIFVGSEAIELRSGPPKSDYAAPETAGGKQGDRRSDVFSLGAILWEALVHERRTAGAFQAPSELNANVPPELDAICKKALAHDPAQRYPSTKVMAAEIATVLEDSGYPDDLSQITAYVKAAFPPVSPGAALAAKLAATPTGSMTPLAHPSPAPASPAPAATAKPALNQTMMGVAPIAVQDALKAVKAAEAKAKEADPTSVAFAGLPEETRTKAESAGPMNPLSFVSKTGTMPPPSSSVTPAAAVAAAAADVPLAAPPGPPNQTAPGGWESGPTPAPVLPATLPAASDTTPLPPSASSAGLTVPSSPATLHAANVTTPLPPSASSAGLTVPSIANANPTQTLPFGSTAITAAELEAAKKDIEKTVEPAASPATEQAAPRAKTPSSGPKLPGLPPEAKPTIASAETVATPALVPTASGAVPVDAPAPGSGLAGLPSLPPGAESSPSASIPSSVLAANAAAVADQPTAPVKQRAGSSPGRTRSPSDAGIDPASAVSLPFRTRRDSQGDFSLEKWASAGESLEVDDGHESDIIEEQRKQRKRLLVVSGGALAAILLVAIIALAVGGKDAPKPKPEDVAALNAPSPTAVDPSAKATDSPVAEPAGVDPNAAVGSGDSDATGSGSAETGSAAVATGSGSAEPALAAGSGEADRLAEEQAAADKAAAEKAAADAAAAELAAKEAALKEENERKANEEKAKEAQQRLAKETNDKKAAEDKAAQQRLAKAAADKKAAEDKAAKAERQRLAREEAAKKAADKKAAQAAAAKKKKAPPKQVASVPIDPYAEPKRPTGDPAALYKQGFQQYVRGDSAGALLTFTEARAANPGYAPTYRGLGLVYEKMGQKDKAKISFKKYLQLSPNAGDADQIRERLARL